MNRRDFLERFVYALTAALLALFGFRPDLEHDEVRRTAKALANRLAPDIAKMSDILKRIYPQASINAIAYRNTFMFGARA